MVAQLDYLARLQQLDELLPASADAEPVPAPGTQPEALLLEHRRRTVDATILLGATCIAAWSTAATVTVLLVR